MIQHDTKLIYRTHGHSQLNLSHWARNRKMGENDKNE